MTDRALQVGFNTTLDSHQMNHVISKTSIKSSFPELGIGTSYNNNILKGKATVFARLKNQNKF